MLIATLLIAAPISLELELAGGPGWPLGAAPYGAPVAPALMARAGADLFEHLTVSATLLGIAGPETPLSFCFNLSGGGSLCQGNASFKAISGLLTLRLHTAGDWQLFAEGGIGPGHLISVSADDLLENAAEHGRGGPAYLAGGGVRWFVAQQVPIGLELAWTSWSNVSRPEFTNGAHTEPARSDLRVSALMLLLSAAWSAGR